MSGKHGRCVFSLHSCLRWVIRGQTRRTKTTDKIGWYSNTWVGRTPARALRSATATGKTFTALCTDTAALGPAGFGQPCPDRQTLGLGHAAPGGDLFQAASTAGTHAAACIQPADPDTRGRGHLRGSFKPTATTPEQTKTAQTSSAPSKPNPAAYWAAEAAGAEAAAAGAAARPPTVSMTVHSPFTTL